MYHAHNRIKSYFTHVVATLALTMSSTVSADLMQSLTTNSDRCPGNQADFEGVQYADEEDHQWLNVYQSEGNGPKPVVIYAHQNGATACDVNTEMLSSIHEAGYTLVSWESIPTIGSESDVETLWADAGLVMEFLRLHAIELELDMGDLVIAGRSRGSGGSWKLAHSDDPAICGIYMPQALPDGFWAFPENWNPLDDITIDSKPIYMPYTLSEPDVDDQLDSHDPRRGLDVVDRYTELGIGHLAEVAMGINRSDYFDYFPSFVSALDRSPLDFSDDFSDGVLESSYLTGNGEWREQNGVLENLDSSKVAFALNGDPQWADYSVSASLRTFSSLEPSEKWQTARLVARMSDSRNHYEFFLRTNGQAVLRSVTDEGATRLLQVNTGLHTDSWNLLSMKLIGDQIELMVNGVSVAIVNDATHAQGYAGFKASLCECQFDDLEISRF